jgi:hypothetical protein
MKKVGVSNFFNSNNLQMPSFSSEFFFMILLFIVFVPSSFDKDINAVSLYAIIPFLFIYSLFQSVSLFTKFRFYRLFIFLFFWILFSGIVAADKDLYWAEIKAILGVVMFSFVLIHFCWKNYRYIYFFYFLYIVKFLYIFLYAYQNGLFAVDLNSERFGLDELNSNVFGYFGFFALIGAFLLATHTQKFQKKFYTFLFYFIFILVVTAGILAASRGTLVVAIIAFTLLLIIRYLYPISLRSVFPLMLIAISAIAIIVYLDNNFQNSLILARFDVKEDSRYSLLLTAFQLGSENPIFGVGAGNFVLYNPEKVFTHNSFAELWATNGAVALILFILILTEVFKNINRYTKLGGDKKISYYFMIIWGTYCIYNFFYVFYINLFMLGFLFLIRIHLEHLNTIRSKNLIKKKQIANLNQKINF